MATEDARSVKLFYSYSHNDKVLRDELAKHLGRSYISWHDREIVPGTDWAREIDANLNSADIILLLISADFMHSDYCYGIEMARALEKQAKGEAWVIPVILRPVHWDDAPFKTLQILPTGGKPVTTWINMDEAFVDIARGVRQTIEKVLKRREDIKNQYVTEAEAYAASGKHEAAYSSYNKALQLFPADASLYKGIGDALFAGGRFSEALSAYDEAVRLRSTQLQLHANRARVLVHLSRLEDAVLAYRYVTTHLASNDFSLYKDLVDVLTKLGRFKEALEIIEKATGLATTDAERLEMYTNKGHVLFALQRYQESIAAHQMAIDLDSKNAQFWRNTDSLQAMAKR